MLEKYQARNKSAEIPKTRYIIVLLRNGRNLGRYDLTILQKNKAPDQYQEPHLKSFFG